MKSLKGKTKGTKRYIKSLSLHNNYGFCCRSSMVKKMCALLILVSIQIMINARTPSPNQYIRYLTGLFTFYSQRKNNSSVCIYELNCR